LPSAYEGGGDNINPCFDPFHLLNWTLLIVRMGR
jgi:hypothetical protein